jgi:apolipoprotein N-acyltransferase
MYRPSDFSLITLAALLLFVSLPPLSWWPFVFCAPVPFLIFLSREGFSRRGFIGSYFFGFVFLLLQYSFVFGFLPLDWIGLSGTVVGVGVVLFFWLLLAGFLALSFLFLPFLFYPRVRALSPFAPYVCFPFFWLGIEIVRSFLYVLLTFGPGSTLGNHFTFGYVGYAAVHSPLLLYSAPYISLYGFSFLFASCGSVLFFLWQRFPHNKKVFVFGFLSLLFIYSLPVGFAQKQVRVIRVLSIQAHNPVVFGYDETYFKKTVDKFTNSIQQGLKEYPDTDLVLLSENSGFFTTYARGENLTPERALEKLLGVEKKRFLIYGEYDPKFTREMAVALSNDASFPETRRSKEVLMPIGEYQPYILGFLARLVGRGDWFSALTLRRGAGAVPFLAEKEKSFPTFFGKAVTLSCSEILSEKAYTHVAKEKPVLILHQQRLAPFHENTMVFQHFLAASRLRAAMLRTPIVGSLDGGGYSYIIDASGRVVALGTSTSSFVYAEVSIADSD